jgi:hypothetical protein
MSSVGRKYIKKALHPKKVPISPGVAFKAEDVPELLDPLKQKYNRSFVAKRQFAARWIRHFDRGITVGTVLRIGRYSSMGSAPPSDGTSF